jgi:hypothetical protein
MKIIFEKDFQLEPEFKPIVNLLREYINKSPSAAVGIRIQAFPGSVESDPVSLNLKVLGTL